MIFLFIFKLKVAQNIKPIKIIDHLIMMDSVVSHAIFYILNEIEEIKNHKPSIFEQQIKPLVS